MKMAILPSLVRETCHFDAARSSLDNGSMAIRRPCPPLRIVCRTFFARKDAVDEDFSAVVVIWRQDMHSPVGYAAP